MEVVELRIERARNGRGGRRDARCKSYREEIQEGRERREEEERARRERRRGKGRSEGGRDEGGAERMETKRQRGARVGR